MRELRIGTFFVLAAAVAALGCDDGNGGTDAGIDSGVVLVDSGPRVDSGPQPDSGPAPDGGGSRTCGNAGECDVLAQNCTDSTTTCRHLIPPGGSEPEGVCEMTGTKLEGEACTRDSGPECAENLFCYNGFCREFCCDGMTADCTVLGHVCQRFVDTPVGFCVPSAGCELLAQTGCDTDEGCYPAADATTQCATPTDTAGGDGHPCVPVNDCLPGFACIPDASGMGMCRAFCDPSAPDCATDYTCNGLRDYDDLGICIPPAS